MSQIPSCRIFRPSRVHHFAAPDGEHGDVFLADGLGAGGSPHYHPYPNRPQHRLPPILAHFAPSSSLCRRATTPAGPPGMELEIRNWIIKLQIYSFLYVLSSTTCLSWTIRQMSALFHTKNSEHCNVSKQCWTSCKLINLKDPHRFLEVIYDDDFNKYYPKYTLHSLLPKFQNVI